MKRVIVFCFFSLLSKYVFSLEPILVTENTFKLNGEKIMFFGFASGDKIIFDFEELEGKEVKEIEIIEMPQNTKVQDYKVIKLTNKTIDVYKKGLYAFRFKNSPLSKRICKVKIQRIPADESKVLFDTGWRYETLVDTTYIPYTVDSIVGYEEKHYTEVVREFVETKYEEHELFDNTVEIRAKGIINNDNPREIITFNLPSFPYDSLNEKRVVTWGFWLATYSVETFWDRNKDNFKKATSSVANYLISPLGGYLTGLVVDLAVPSEKQGNSVKYYITDAYNGDLFYKGLGFTYDYCGSGSGAKSKISNRRFSKDMLCMCLENPNLHYRINVTVKASAIVEVKSYKNVTYNKTKNIPIYVTLNKKRMVLSKRKVMVMNDSE